jgi:hypothetical protein
LRFTGLPKKLQAQFVVPQPTLSTKETVTL